VRLAVLLRDSTGARARVVEGGAIPGLPGRFRRLGQRAGRATSRDVLVVPVVVSKVRHQSQHLPRQDARPLPRRNRPCAAEAKGGEKKLEIK
jgi:hypothetical protein